MALVFCSGQSNHLTDVLYNSCCIKWIIDIQSHTFTNSYICCISFHIKWRFLFHFLFKIFTIFSRFYTLQFDAFLCREPVWKMVNTWPQKFLCYPLSKIGVFDFLISWIFRKKKQRNKKKVDFWSILAVFVSPSMLI